VSDRANLRGAPVNLQQATGRTPTAKSL